MGASLRVKGDPDLARLVYLKSIAHAAILWKVATCVMRTQKSPHRVTGGKGGFTVQWSVAPYLTGP
jgi:hypothetical protein